MNVSAAVHRFRWLQLPGGLLVMFLQRTPVTVLRVAAQLESVIADQAPLLLRSGIAAAAMGAYNSVAGATTFNIAPATPASGKDGTLFSVPGTVGTPLTVSFTVTGAPVSPHSWSVNSTATLPAGLSVTGGNPVNVAAPYKMTITGTPTTAITSTVTVTAWENANESGNSGTVSVSFVITGGVVATLPSITSPPVTQTVTVGSSVTFTASASGTPSPTYQWEKGGVAISGATTPSLALSNVQTTDAGSYTVVATNSAGSATATATLTVNQLAQTITFGPLPAVSYTTAPIALTAAASSALPVGFAVTTGPATITGNSLTLTGVGNVTVSASQAGNETYAAATPVAQSFAVNPATAAVTFGNLSFTYDGTAKGTTVTTVPASLPVTLTYDGGPASPTNAGSYAVVGTVTAPNYQGSATGTLVIAKADQTIAFAGPASQPFGPASLPLNATASSGLPVSFAVLSGPAGLNGNSLSLTGAGLVTVSASQGGDTNFNAAPAVSASFTVAANFASWQLSAFPTPALLDPKLSGPAAVYGSDGLPNLVKYALGLDPTQNVTTGLPVATTDRTNWIYTYTRPSDRSDVVCTVEVSTDLQTWTTAGVTQTLVSSAGGIDTWQAVFPASGTGRVFFRLNVTGP
jgi:hypothetical protein